MLTQPTIVERPEQPYMAIKGAVTMRNINAIADELPEVFGWLGERGIAWASAPFFKYNVIDMERGLEIEVGVPIAATVPGEGKIFAGVLPAGRYVTVTHVGHPAELQEVTRGLLAWAAEQGLEWDMSDSDEGEVWGCRLEFYKTDPREESDMGTWEQELAFRLAD